jgi:hypothetical protein
MNTLTHSQLVALLAGIKGATFASLISQTDARLKKTGNPLALPVVKQAIVSVTIGAEYQSAVNREANRQESQAEFIAGALPKGRNWLVHGKVLVSDDGSKLYLRTQSTPGQRQRKFAKLIGYKDATGAPVTKQAVKPFLPIAYESSKQQGATGICETVHVRDYLFTSIRSIRLNGETFKLVAE